MIPESLKYDGESSARDQYKTDRVVMSTQRFPAQLKLVDAVA
jgi:hypothetical protein